LDAIPADHNWCRDLSVAEIIAEALAALRPRSPGPAEPLPDDLLIE
jgi:hypothetical protein